jgi:hypothetical protein
MDTAILVLVVAFPVGAWLVLVAADGIARLVCGGLPDTGRRRLDRAANAVAALSIAFWLLILPIAVILRALA